MKNASMSSIEVNISSSLTPAALASSADCISESRILEEKATSINWLNLSACSESSAWNKSYFCWSCSSSLYWFSRYAARIACSFAYLQHYGSVSCGGHELTGITTDNNLDVVLVTKRNLKKNPSVTMPLYVIEETHMDGIVVWQASTGEVFQTEYMDLPLKIYDSLAEYVSSFPEELQEQADWHMLRDGKCE